MVARDEVVLATKAGISRRTGARVTDASRGTCCSTLDASLRRLGVDHVDLWQVHTWVDDTPLEETLSALDHAVATGRASYVGISNYSGWQTAQAATWQRAVPGRAPLASTQVEYSLLEPRHRGRGAPRGRGAGPGRAALVAAGRGVLTGKYRTGTPSDSRARLPALRGLRRAPTSTSAAAASSRPSPGPPTGSAGRRWRWPWPGCATVPG